MNLKCSWFVKNKFDYIALCYQDAHGIYEGRTFCPNHLEQAIGKHLHGQAMYELTTEAQENA